MRRLATLSLLSALVLPVSAAEVGLLADKQIGKAQVLGVNQKTDAIGPTGLGLRAGFKLLDLKVIELGLAGTYHAKAEEELEAGSTKLGKYGTEYIALGAQVDWKFLVNLHLGMEMRREKYSTTVLTLQDGVTVTRPWVRAGLGFSVPTPLISPFLRVELAMATTKEDKLDTAENRTKALAPHYQVGLYGGIRF